MIFVCLKITTEYLSKQEIDFLFNTFIPLNFDILVEGEQKSKLQLFLDAHNPQKVIALSDRLEFESNGINHHFKKAFSDKTTRGYL